MALDKTVESVGGRLENSQTSPDVEQSRKLYRDLIRAIRAWPSVKENERMGVWRQTLQDRARREFSNSLAEQHRGKALALGKEELLALQRIGDNSLARTYPLDPDSKIKRNLPSIEQFSLLKRDVQTEFAKISPLRVVFHQLGRLIRNKA